MATYTDSLGFDKGNAAYGYSLPRVHLIEVELDFAAITAARSAAGATALTDGDILEVISLPAKSMVLACGLDVTTTEGGTCTVDIGDGDDGDGYLDGVNANTIASYGPASATIGTGLQRYYAAADTIDLTMVNAMDTAVVRLWAVVANCG